MKREILALACAVLIAGTAATAAAHVPYIERNDLSWLVPFEITDVTQSIAVYAWLQTSSDVDVYTFRVTEPVRLFAEVIVPVCPAYEAFLPSYAIVGPGLPAPSAPLPLPLPLGYGAIVVDNVPPGTPRTTFYEPFGGKSYYSGVAFDEAVSGPGPWAILVWDPYESGGDYVMTSGYVEEFGRAEVLRSLVTTPYIRRNKELHTACP